MTPEAFWASLNRSYGDCWIWTGARQGDGHGTVTFNRRAWTAHRFAWMLTNGEIPQGALICHHCDIPPCCNPAHLYAGSRRQNALDAKQRGKKPWRALLAAAGIAFKPRRDGWLHPLDREIAAHMKDMQPKDGAA